MNSSNETAHTMLAYPSCPPEPPGRSNVEMLAVTGLVVLGLAIALWTLRRWMNRRDELSLRGTRRHRGATPPPPAA